MTWLGWTAAGALVIGALFGLAAWRFQSKFGVRLWPFALGPLYTNVYPGRVRSLLETLLGHGHDHG